MSGDNDDDRSHDDDNRDRGAARSSTEPWIRGFRRHGVLGTISAVMDAAAVSHLKPAASELLLAHCSALDSDDRVPARPPPHRLEALVGSELARRLVARFRSPGR